jgi:hypothetical protein
MGRNAVSGTPIPEHPNRLPSEVLYTAVQHIRSQALIHVPNKWDDVGEELEYSSSRINEIKGREEG